MNIQNTVKDFEEKTWNEAINFITYTCEHFGYKLVKSCECGLPKSDRKELLEKARKFYNRKVRKELFLEHVKCLKFKKSSRIPFLLKEEEIIFVIEGNSKINRRVFGTPADGFEFGTKYAAQQIKRYGQKIRFRPDIVLKNLSIEHEEIIRTPVRQLGIISCYVHGGEWNNYNGSKEKTYFGCSLERIECLGKKTQGKRHASKKKKSTRKDYRVASYWGPTLSLSPVVIRADFEDVMQKLTGI